MITAVTLNTAVDKLYIVDSFSTGEVTRVKECIATAGGKGLNVARVVSILGENVVATGFAGGHSGRYVEEMLKKDKIKSSFVHVEGESRTCINIIDKSGVSTELLEPGAAVTMDEQDKFTRHMQRAIGESNVVVLSGSTPPGCGADYYGKLISIAKDAGKKVILDTSGKNLQEGVKALPTMIKPNKDEIKSLLGVDIANKKDVVEAAKRLHGIGIPYVVISMGKYGAIAACAEGVFEGVPPDVKVVNTVGCGDSMTAAFAVGFSRGYKFTESFKFALAVSSASAMCKQTGYLDMDGLKKILSEGQVTKLS